MHRVYRYDGYAGAGSVRVFKRGGLLGFNIAVGHADEGLIVFGTERVGVCRVEGFGLTYIVQFGVEVPPTVTYVATRVSATWVFGVNYARHATASGRYKGHFGIDGSLFFYHLFCYLFWLAEDGSFCFWLFDFDLQEHEG